MNPDIQILNRYTSLPIVLDMLLNRRINLLSPESWEDRNDAYYLEKYKKEKELQTILAICFSSVPETFHAWRIFASGLSGVCVEFDRERLLHAIPQEQGFNSSDMDYHFVDEVESKRPEPKQWPFLKRKPFKDECEFRIIYESKTELLSIKHIAIDLSCVRKITLSPWLSEPTAKSVSSIINSILGCGGLCVNPSSLIENSRWKKALDQTPSATHQKTEEMRELRKDKSCEEK